MNFEEKKNSLIGLLNEFLKRPVVMKNQEFPRPQKNQMVDYPFLAYTVTSHRITDEGRGNYSYEKDPESSDSLISIKENQVKFSISFSSYSRIEEESKSLCTSAIHFFEHIGYEALRKLDITVVDITNVSARDEFQTDTYERITGFDVICRTTETIEKNIETIETTGNIVKKVK